MALDVSYTYDGAGNRLTATDNLASTTTTYTYDAANQLATSQDSGGTTDYEYDGAGNLVSSIAPGVGPTISNTWDDENRLTKVETDGVTTQTAEYNGDGLRVKKVTSAETRKFIWDGQTYLAETDENDVTQVRYTQRPGPYGDLISQKRGAGTSSSEWFHYDALGSTVNVTDINESIPETYEYDAWGKLLDTYSFLPPFLYVGRLGYYYDSHTSDYYVRARTYSPGLARWLSRDPIGFADGEGVYQYCHNSPVSYSDPSGAYTFSNAANSLSRQGVRRLGVRRRDFLGDEHYYTEQQKFDEWYKLEKARGEWWKDLDKCPCEITCTRRCKKVYRDEWDRLRTAWINKWIGPQNPDKTKWEDPEKPSTPEATLHPGAKYSMRSKTKAGVQGYNQCIYDHRCNLITDPPGAGTVDYKKAGALAFDHFEHDVWPVMVASGLDGGRRSGGPRASLLAGAFSYPDPIGANLKKYFEVRPTWWHCVHRGR